ncbi:hypothetical protein M426DRAFT_102415 [Hypoxylon sp. CI-4A]|nr:hypothetical protein M426DRAFT_102415 [Hypoxylon sp. CI-4A]
MRSSIRQRRTRANDLRIFIREDVPDAAEDSDSDSEGEPDSPDSPSPTSASFPSPSAASSTQQSAEITSTASNSQPSSVDAAAAQAASTQDNEIVQAQTSQVDNGMTGSGKNAVIAGGAIGATVIVAAIIFLIWKLRRRRSRDRGGLFSGFKRMEEPQQEKAYYGPPGKTQSRIMDDLMAAAYAAEDGNTSQYGGYVDEKRQTASAYGPGPTQPTPARQSGGQNSLYVNQLMSGFYKGQRTDGLAVPGNARMPPPAAPSVAGQTEVTATTESTWRTWGWSQEKKPKESWTDKVARLRGRI